MSDPRPPYLRAFDERMKPVVAGERVRRQAAELPKLGDHVRLIRVAQINGGTSPIDARARARVHQPGLKACQPAVKLRPDTDILAKSP